MGFRQCTQVGQSRRGRLLNHALNLDIFSIGQNCLLRQGKHHRIGQGDGVGLGVVVLFHFVIGRIDNVLDHGGDYFVVMDGGSVDLLRGAHPPLQQIAPVCFGYGDGSGISVGRHSVLIMKRR